MRRHRVLKFDCLGPFIVNRIPAVLAPLSACAFGAAEVPPADMRCDNGISPDSPSWLFAQCTFPPHISKYVPDRADWDFKAAYLVPEPLPVTPSLKLKLHFDGYSAQPDGCTDRSYAEEGYITLKNGPGHYPDVSLYAVNGIEPLDWGGVFDGGESSGWRFAATINRANELWGEAIDWGTGITLEGDTYGGTTGILQSVILPDQWWRHQIAIVNAVVPHTLFVRVDTTHGSIEEGGDGIDQSGGYWRDPAVRLAWGSYDPDRADIVKRVQTVRNIYFRIDGSPVDTSVVFDIDFFRKVCDDGKVACFGTWHNAGHNLDETDVNLPFSELYSGPDMSVRLDRMLPIFTHSTANYWGPRGHYNLGLEWARTLFHRFKE